MVAAAKVYSNYIFYSNLFNCLTKDVIAGKERLLEGARNGFGELKLPHRIGEIGKEEREKRKRNTGGGRCIAVVGTTKLR